MPDKRLVALAVGSTPRSSILPDVPTTEEEGFANNAYTFWVGMRHARTRLERPPEVRDRLGSLGAGAPPTTPADFDKIIARSL